jgi:hypothetical protein
VRRNQTKELLMSKQETVHRPLSRSEIFTRFDTETSTSKHLLILYSLAIGVNAKTIVDLGLGRLLAPSVQPRW